MSSEDFTAYLKENNLLLVNKDAFLNLMIEVNLKTQVDKRVRWIDKKTAVGKYGVSKHWLNVFENNNSPLKVKKGVGKTSPKKYNEQSIIDAQEWEFNVNA